jgi:hypothetical protein
MKTLVHISFLALFTLPFTIHAQHVYRCTGAGQITYSDRPCSNETQARRINAKPNSLDTSEEIAHTKRQQWQQEREREYEATERQRLRDDAQNAQNAQTDQRYENERKELLRDAKTPLPGSQGGLTRSQREAAIGLSRTENERNELMRVATTVMSGAHGLTASQRDAASRLSAANRGLPMPPPARIDDTHSPTSPEQPSLVVNCDPVGCWDTNGRRLIRAGGGNFTRSDGRFCTSAGPNVVCH